MISNVPPNRQKLHFLNQPLLESNGFDAGNPGRSSWFLTGGCQEWDKRKMDKKESRLTICHKKTAKIYQLK